jgi:hypothetical protein
MKRRKVNWTDNILRGSCRLIHIIEVKVEGRKEEEGGVSIYWKILAIERGSTRSHILEISLWQSLWTCRKTHGVIVIIIIIIIINWKRTRKNAPHRTPSVRVVFQ